MHTALNDVADVSLVLMGIGFTAFSLVFHPDSWKSAKDFTSLNAFHVLFIWGCVLLGSQILVLEESWQGRIAAVGRALLVMGIVGAIGMIRKKDPPGRLGPYERLTVAGFYFGGLLSVVGAA